ncbi:MAG: V-type ATP synthase subunit F [Clostridia bacterium]|nr:V-type ATP synthase subunit F [Clostridia bacterium]
MPSKIGAVGNAEALTAFRAIGVDVFDCKTAQSAKETVLQLSKTDYAVIFITEELAKDLKDFLRQYKSVPYPAILPIPSADGATGFTMQGIKEDMERAIGADILFNKD